MRRPEISAIVCTYRREEALRETLSDLMAQEGVDAEVLVIDQTEQHEPNTLTFFDDHAARLQRIFVAEPNLPNARNVGLDAARADVAVFVDDDLRVPRDVLRHLLDHFVDRDVDGCAPVVDVEGYPDASTRPRNGATVIGAKGHRRVRVATVIGACVALRRDAALAIGGFDALLGRLDRQASGEDHDFCRRFVSAGYRLWMATETSVLHRPFVPGGCEVRTGSDANALLPHIRASTYIILKEEHAFERITARAMLRMARAHVLNRKVLAGGPRAIGQAIRTMTSVVSSVRGFWREQHTRP